MLYAFIQPLQLLKKKKNTEDGLMFSMSLIAALNVAENPYKSEFISMETDLPHGCFFTYNILLPYKYL